jgi:hypothetical protein
MPTNQDASADQQRQFHPEIVKKIKAVVQPPLEVSAMRISLLRLSLFLPNLK